MAALLLNASSHKFDRSSTGTLFDAINSRQQVNNALATDENSFIRTVQWAIEFTRASLTKKQTQNQQNNFRASLARVTTCWCLFLCSSAVAASVFPSRLKSTIRTSVFYKPREIAKITKIIA
jgi:hypothetical protein